MDKDIEDMIQASVDADGLRAHFERQQDAPDNMVRLNDGSLVPLGGKQDNTDDGDE